jgi:hypothetical protein
MNRIFIPICLLVLTFSFLQYTVAQDFEESKTKGLIWKYSEAKLPANAQTFSVTWENSSRTENAFFEFANLKFDKEKADIKLLIKIGNITMGSPKLVKYGYGSNPTFCYEFNFSGTYGIKVVSSKDSLIYDKTWQTYFYRTQMYNSESDLKAEWGVNKIPRDFGYTKVLEFVQDKFRNDFVFSKHEIEFTGRIVTDKDPAFNILKESTKELLKTVSQYASSPSATPASNPTIEAAIAKLKIELAKVNWERKKEKFNKKIGNAILENVVFACLTTGNYADAKIFYDKFYENNSGLFADILKAKMKDSNYKGFTTMRFSGPEVNARDAINEIYPSYESYNKK